MWGNLSACCSDLTAYVFHTFTLADRVGFYLELCVYIDAFIWKVRDFAWTNYVDALALRTGIYVINLSRMTFKSKYMTKLLSDKVAVSVAFHLWKAYISYDFSRKRKLVGIVLTGSWTVSQMKYCAGFLVFSHVCLFTEQSCEKSSSTLCVFYFIVT